MYVRPCVYRRLVGSRDVIGRSYSESAWYICEASLASRPSQPPGMVDSKVIMEVQIRKVQCLADTWT